MGVKEEVENRKGEVARAQPTTTSFLPPLGCLLAQGINNLDDENHEIMQSEKSKKFGLCRALKTTRKIRMN